jgi:hypothetical protein
MRQNRPDFFIHNGDNIYADNPMAAEQKMPNGDIWKNVVTVEKSKPAETLDGSGPTRCFDRQRSRPSSQPGASVAMV